MHPIRLARLPLRSRPSHLPIAVLVLIVIALFAAPGVGADSSIASRVLIDPAGEHTGDEFGRSVAWVGDVNGDGYDDVLVGAFRYPEIASAGLAYLYFGGPAMHSVADLVIPPPPGGAGWFGVSVASAGDFNGDGYPDFIIGAQQSGYEGKAFVYYGGPLLDATPDFMLTGESTGQLIAFGASVASAGDVNGDGFDDVIVGAPWYPGGGNKPGRAYVFFGGDPPNAVADRVFTGVGFYDQLGSVVGSAGDINGDGHPDVFASAPNNTAAALGAGALYVWFGGPAFDATPDVTLLGSSANEHLMNAANAGDVNADGFSDLIGAGRTQVSVWFGGSTPNSVPDLTFARSYASVAGAGDVNSDGIDDFVVGASGRVSIYFGGGAVDTGEDLYYVGDPGASVGICVAGGGHVDGPGPADVVASAYWDPEAVGYNMGRVYVFANSSSGLLSLSRTAGATRLSWTNGGAGVCQFDIVRGDLNVLAGDCNHDAVRGDCVAGNFTTALNAISPGTDVCMANDSTASSLSDSRADPGPRRGEFYLLRSVAGCGASGSYNDGTEAASRDPGIGAAANHCP